MSNSQDLNTAYRVLARKYRPQNFDELIGQETLVRTLKNAIETGRIAHAFMLTGVRGVGKTTTARIIAKALNYTGADGKSGPSVGDTSDCQLCQAITEDRHPDVIEMDAASRTGVDDVREILDGVRYAPSEARYKVYIIDEVHMLSKQAFNALLKTLEEPPEHVKFIFATTEIRKVPITVLSRCQRFDLRRVNVEELSKHFANICSQEDVQAEDEALALIARAADGSVRDGLSLLDQAMAMATDQITAAQVQDMLGLGDRARNLDILEASLQGNAAKALDICDDLYRAGSDPSVLIQDLLDLTHILTRLRAVPTGKETVQSLSADQLDRASEMATKLSMPSLSKAWQILLKGLQEVNMAANPQSAAEMVIIRLCYAANLPDPAELIKTIKDVPADSASSNGVGGAGANHSSNREPAMAVHHGGGVTAAAVSSPNFAPQSEAETALAGMHDIQDLNDVVRVLEQSGEMIVAGQVFNALHLVKLENKGEKALLEVRPADHAPPALVQGLGKILTKATGLRWMVSVSRASGAPTLAEVEEERKQKELAEIKANPLVAEIINLFPGAQITDIKNV